MKKILLIAAATLVAPAVFADPTVNDGFSLEYKRGDLTGKSFTGTSYTTAGEETGYALTLPGGNVYFTGEGELTITEITGTPTKSGNYYATTDSFIVEGTTVIIDGDSINIDELGLNLSIGTMEDATLTISGGAKVRTGGYLNTIGSTNGKGTVNITGEGSILDMQQTTIGGGVSSLFGVSGTTEGAYWVQYLISDAEYDAVIEKLTSGYTTDSSYGVVNITEGGTWQVGVGNADSSINKLQLSNGEINVAGEGSQLIMGSNSRFILQGENGFTTSEGKILTGVYYSEKITVTNGGTITNEDGTTLDGIILGNSFYESNTKVEISVDGEGSTFDLTSGKDVRSTVYIGSNSGYFDNYSSQGYDAQTDDGGSVTVEITATDGGEFKISTENEAQLYVAADGYADNPQDHSKSQENVGHSYGINVSFTAEYGENGSTGGYIVLDIDGTVYFGMGSPTDGYENNLDVKASGKGSSVEISSNVWNVYTNYNADNLATTFLAEDGGTIAISAGRDVIFGNNEARDEDDNKIEYTGTNTNSSVDLKATGDGSMITVSGEMIRAAYETEGMTVNFTAEDGGKVVFSTEYTGNNTTTSQSNIFLGYGAATEMNIINVTATGTDSVFYISAETNLLANYQATNFKTTFLAEDGGDLILNGKNVLLGYSYKDDDAHDGTGSSVNLKATGNGSKIEVIADEVIDIGYRADGSTAEVLAEDGGYISIYASGTSASAVYLGQAGDSESTAETNISVTATGANSVVDIYGYAAIITNDERADNVHVYLTATDSGTLKLSTTGTTGTTNGILLSKNTVISVTNNSGLITTGAIAFEAGASITIDATSTWKNAGNVYDNIYFHDGSNLSITVGESAITLEGEEHATSNVDVCQLFFYEGSSVDVVIDISSLDYYTSASIAVITATEIYYDYVSGATGEGVKCIADGTEYVYEFVDEYINLEEIGFTIDSWEWIGDDTQYGDFGTLYVNITTLPEPSMFGLFFGLGALGLVATRRRRRA